LPDTFRYVVPGTEQGNKLIRVVDHFNDLAGGVFLLLLLTLTGCGVGSNASQDTTFDPQGSNKAVVIMGLSGLRYGTLLGLTDYASVGSMTLNWTAVRGSSRAIVASRGKCALSFSAQCDQTQMVHLVLTADPGDYRLSSFLNGISRGMIQETVRLNFTGPALTIHLDPGKIVYVGDFVFDVVGKSRLAAYRRSDDEARSTLAKYPGIHGEMVYEAPLVEGRGPLAPGKEPVMATR
jgi:hypothetical protein